MGSMQPSSPSLRTDLRVGDACFLPQHHAEVVIADAVAGRYCCAWTERGVQRRAWVRPEELQPGGAAAAARPLAEASTATP
jgi:uncharacterized protein YodC (DUF2158 family)